MKREDLELDDGLLCLSINGKSETVFNPTDIGFIEKIYKVFDSLTEKQDAMEARVKSAAPREIFDVARKADAEMREMVDGVMGAGTCAAQFGEMNVYAYAQGLPVWATERLHFHFSLSCIGEGNGNPLQCSCLENPRDGKAW